MSGMCGGSAGVRESGVRVTDWDGGCRVWGACVSCRTSLSDFCLPVCMLISNTKLELAKTKLLIASSARLALGLALDLGSSDR
eukprot:scaffold2678_cov140-Isochrysis_galbana.AAC.4